jgi:pantoate--beta-alanine ligase
MIKVFTTQKDFLHFRSSLKGKTIGLVPTMGNLHAGHISLLEQSAEENDISIVTIFVNPKQFGPNEDFNKYPRTLNEDIAKISATALLINAKKEIVVFAPNNNDEIFNDAFSTTISVGPITKILEGSIRPTHFDGVTTVVYKLFSLTKPTVSYFGQKDFQQCLVIKKMVKDLDLSTQIKIMPIFRSKEGLALSSRNQYLSDTDLKEALYLPQSLIEIEKLLLDKKDYLQFRDSLLKDQTFGKRWDYCEILDAETLAPLTPATKQAVIVAAFRCQSTRLLDNRLVNLNHT